MGHEFFMPIRLWGSPGNGGNLMNFGRNCVILACMNKLNQWATNCLQVYRMRLMEVVMPKGLVRRHLAFGHDVDCFFRVRGGVE